MNTLLEKFDTPFGTIPFDKIETSYFLPAIQDAIKESKAEIEKIKDNRELSTFENTLVALEKSGEKVELIASIFFNLNAAETNDEIQKLAREISPLLSAYSNDILLDQDLYTRIKAVYDKREKMALTVEQRTLLDKTYRSFTRNGANLPNDKKEKLRELDKELSQLSLEFGEHLLKEVNTYQMAIEEEAELDGLPDHAKEAAAEAARERDLEGKWVITLEFPSYMAFMKYAKNRKRREELYRVFSSKGAKRDENDNREIVKKIARLRHDRARLLGFESHAHFVLQERMAESPGKVLGFLQDLLQHAKPAAESELEEITSFAKKLDGIGQLQRWDISYYAEKLKKEKYSIDDELLKPYFAVEKVIDGVFKVAGKLYGLRFRKNKDVPVYHPDVTAYEVEDDRTGRHMGIFYADFFPRKGKRDGAWMTAYRGQNKLDDVDKRPHVSIVCNFTKPTANTPSLLTFNEVTTLFHEFGHALHGLLADTTYESLSGTNVYWDFVELPSQVMENWAYEKECLDLFAEHYQTGEKIPASLVERVKESAKFLEGYQTVRQISFGLLDMAWHQGDPSTVENVDAFEKEAIQSAELFPKVDGSLSSTAFAHIFQGGYASGYYSYKWAEVLDADAFEYFLEEGIFNPEVAGKFREFVLSKGGSEHPMELYRKFRGKEPSPDALLRRAGLITAEE